MAVVSFCNGAVIGGLSYFTPPIVQGLGYGKTQTQLLSVPPYAIAFVLTMIAATFADRCHQRGIAGLESYLHLDRYSIHRSVPHGC